MTVDDWNGPTTMVEQVVRVSRPIPPPPLPPVLVIVPATGDLLLRTKIQEAVALWYEREYGRPMPAGCARTEGTAAGSALFIYERPVG